MSKTGKVIIIISTILITILVITGIYAYKYYNYIFAPNVDLGTQQTDYLYISTGSDYNDVLDILVENKIIINRESFEFVAGKKNYPSIVISGRYQISNGMSNNELVNLLRSGTQSPVNVTFISLRTLEILAGRVSVFIEADSLNLINKMKDPDIHAKYGFNENTFISMFIPDTYQFYWNTSADGFIERMAKEYRFFWNEQRKSKATELGLSQSEISTLASIVEAETQKNDEKERIAGVYMNRLKRGWLLQADPTVVYATGDFSIKRVLKKHLEIDSPYNTYKYTGLPPGPINIPSVSSIDAVLNYEKHSYMYFCAKDDFSGYHSFAITLQQHNANARKYHQALRTAGIR